MTPQDLEQQTSARPDRGKAAFQTTQWSLVLAAGARGNSPNALQALERLCREYWTPIYACVRHSGRNREEAEDLTQDFFAALLQYDSLAKVEPTKGRFRSFLRAALKHFLCNQWHRERARKRGGGRPVLSLDEAPELERELQDHRRDVTPDQAFDQRWAQTVLARAMKRLRREYEAGGQGRRFEVLKVYLLAGSNPGPYADSARELGLSDAAVKSAIYKLRRRYGEMLRAEISQTLSNPSEVEDELRHLIAAFAS